MNTQDLKDYVVATFCANGIKRYPVSWAISAYTKHGPDHPSRVDFAVRAVSRREAIRLAKHMRVDYENDRTAATTESLYRLKEDDPRFGLQAGDVLVCEPMHWAWASEKIAVKHRQRDGYDPGCSQYRHQVEYVSGPRL
jgi:hypothetical protein